MGFVKYNAGLLFKFFGNYFRNLRVEEIVIAVHHDLRALDLQMVEICKRALE